MQSGSNRNSCERHSHHVPCFHDGSAWFMELRAACSQMAFSEPGRLSETRPSRVTASGAAQLCWLHAAPPFSRLGGGPLCQERGGGSPKKPLSAPHARPADAAWPCCR